MQRIRPLALAEAVEPPAPAAGEDKLDHPLEVAPQLPGFDVSETGPGPASVEGRLDRWQRKLLDLTTRNRLLSLKHGAATIRLVCPAPADLEDRLAEGTSFRVVGMPGLEGAAGRDAALHQQRTGEDIDEAYARDAMERGEVLSPLPPEKLDAALVELYRKSRLDMAEGGANTLFLAVGFLTWRKSETDIRIHRAPLVLLPVRLERRSARSGVRLSHHEDEPRFNLTLLQMLRQDFDLDIPELAGSLPADESGVDVPKVWNLVRRAVRDIAGFEVVEDVVLGSFSFAKYLMWKDLIDRTEALKANRVVRHLLETPRDPYHCDGEPPRPEALDGEVGPGDLFTPLPADSSQLAAVVGSGRGCDFVLDGPPGTGKSQTIANMIAHNLALGRKVLFVAEKRAALEVVHRRLVAQGLGPFCLELHSNKASKQEVLRQLDTSWSTVEAAPGELWDRRATELKTSRDGLNRLVASLHRRHENGLSLYEAVGRVVRDGADAAIPLDWDNEPEQGEARMEARREAVRRLEFHRPALVERESLETVGRTEWSNAWQAEIVSAAVAMGPIASAMDNEASRFARAIGVELGRDAKGLAAAADLAGALRRAAGSDLAFAFAPDAGKAIEHVRGTLPHVASYAREAAGLTAIMEPAAVGQLDLTGLEAAWSAAKAAIWPMSIFRRKAVAQRLAAGGKADPEKDLPRLRVLQGLLIRIEESASYTTKVPGWAGTATDIAAVTGTLDAAEAIRSAIVRAAETPEQLASLRLAVRRLCSEASELLAADAAIGRACDDFRTAHSRFSDALSRYERTASSTTPIDADDLPGSVKDLSARVSSRATQLNAWTAWRRARGAADELGLGPIAAAVEAGTIPPGGASEAFELAYAHWWAGRAIDEDPVVRDFSHAEQADAVRRFREMDDRFADLTRSYIRARLSGAIPAKDAKDQAPGFGALAHQLKLQKRHKPVRQLVAEMGPALTTLTPCLLMSPLSVAQYLPADAALFDLVIFDEASQITPWDAVGAIARGRQLVVAGDPRQMPPTSFFDRAGGADDDEGDVEADQESILDECLGARLPRRRLTWHYRSRHESLIAFSNHRYYDGDLITFPAPVTRDRAVSLRRVSGAWSRGKSRTNQAEAEAIVAEVVARLADPGFVDEAGRRLTLGVITLNAEQQKLIEDLLDRARRARPELEPYFADDAAEPVVVKNLETVQGDERDVILLGIGYGPETPDAPVMAMNFGPLNRGGGWRRLNVAITRARREMVVFTSFPPNLIDLNRTSAQAVRDLKHFLEFAERGPQALGEAIAGSVGGFESPFEQAVARALRERGWTVVPQIGVSRFRIDLGVVHPDSPGDFLLGVECDGASYHSAATARDRDKVREAVLAALGWRLARVWSTDWWIDARGALDRLDATIAAALAASREAAAQTPLRSENPTAPVPLFQDNQAGPVPDPADPADADEVERALGGSYRATTFERLRDAIEPTRFNDPAYAGALRQMIAAVVEQEGPVRDDLLVERIARAHGFKRSGRVIRDRVISLLRGSAHLETEQGGAVFVWADAATMEGWSEARYPATANDVRSLEEISLREIAAALGMCGSEDRASEAARAFGIRRVSSSARERMDRAAPPAGHLSV